MASSTRTTLPRVSRACSLYDVATISYQEVIDEEVRRDEVSSNNVTIK